MREHMRNKTHNYEFSFMNFLMIYTFFKLFFVLTNIIPSVWMSKKRVYETLKELKLLQSRYKVKQESIVRRRANLSAKEKNRQLFNRAL